MITQKALNKIEKAFKKHGAVEVEYNGNITEFDIVDSLIRAGYDFTTTSVRATVVRITARDIPRVYVEV